MKKSNNLQLALLALQASACIAMFNGVLVPYSNLYAIFGAIPVYLAGKRS
jgi:hypothetical protein